MDARTTDAARLVRHVLRFRDGAWDEAVLHRTKICLLDSLSSFSGGVVIPHFQQSAAGVVRAISVGGVKPDLSPILKGYLYGQAVISMDYDDSFYGHPGGPIIAALLAIGSERGLSSDRLLRGIAAGYEAHGILCAASDPTPKHAALVRSVGNADTVAAAIGAAIALGYSEERVTNLIGVAVSHSIVPYTAKWYSRPVPGVKNNVGWIAAGAILAIHLAEEGLTGVSDPLEGEQGFWRMIGSDRWCLDEVLFSKKAAVLRTGFKRFPACWWTQPYLIAFDALLKNLEPGDRITEVLVSATRDIEKFCDEALIGTVDVAFSLPAMFNCQIGKIEPGPEWALAKTSVAVPSFEYRESDSCVISVRTARNVKMSMPVTENSMVDGAAYGLTDDEVVEKFRRLANGSLRAAGDQWFLATDLAEVVPVEVYDAISEILRATFDPK